MKNDPLKEYLKASEPDRGMEREIQIYKALIRIRYLCGPDFSVYRDSKQS